MVKRGNPEVREWMKEHKEEVEGVQEKYDALKMLSLGELAEMADDEGVDVSKVKELLISKIIASESAR